MTILARLEKARLEVNALRNTASRALYALDRAIEECCDDGHTHDPAPEEPPIEEPPQGHEEPPVSDWVRADSIVPIPSNFDIEAWLTDGPVPPFGGAEEPGAFRFTAFPGHLNYDDPIVFPGRPGAAHLHDQCGNTLLDAHSTYASLRAAGRSTSDMDMLNRSGYWFPGMLDGMGNVVRANHIVGYYKSYPVGHPRLGGIGTNLPHGLKMVFGNNYPEEEWGDERPAYFDLRRGGEVIIGGRLDLEEILDRAQVGDFIHVTCSAPDCWDGEHIDSPDHRSHMAYRRRDNHTGQMLPPPSHPFVVPRIELKPVFEVLPGDNPKLWNLSSDTTKQGASLHADAFLAWDPTVLQMMWDHALQKQLNCSAGELGNGKQMKRHPDFPGDFKHRPHLVPVP